MHPREAHPVMKQYLRAKTWLNILSLLVYFVFIFAVVFVNQFVSPPIWLTYLAALLLGCIYQVLYERIHQRVLQKTLLTSLAQELDAAKYQEILTSAPKKYTPTYRQRLGMAYHSGDYALTVNLAAGAFGEKMSPAFKYILLNWLASVYFNVDDKEKLQAVCDAFDRFSKKSKNPEKLRAKYPVFVLYRAYAAGDYSACLSYLDDSANQLNPTDFQYSLEKVTGKFSRGVIAYRSGDLVGAKAYFEETNAAAPKLHLAQLAQTYLTAMEKEEEVIFPEILPDADFAIFTPEQRKKQKTKKTLGISLMVIAVVCFIIGCAGDIRDSIYSKWRFTNEDCRHMFNCSLTEFLEINPSEYSLPENFFDKYEIDEDGALILSMTEKQENALRHSPILTSSGNPRIEISEDGREMIIRTYKETAQLDAAIAFNSVYLKLCLMQELDGLSYEDWVIVFIIRDGVTGEEYYRNQWPEESKPFNAESYPIRSLPNE